MAAAADETGGEKLTGSEHASRCYFATIPAEMRNRIYELVFAPAVAQGTHVDLFAASPPSKSIVLTNRLFHGEARGLYRAAYRDYWRTTRFSVDVRGAKESEVHDAIERLGNAEVAAISSVVLTGGVLEFEMTAERCWTCRKAADKSLVVVGWPGNSLPWDDLFHHEGRSRQLELARLPDKRYVVLEFVVTCRREGYEDGTFSPVEEGDRLTKCELAWLSRLLFLKRL